jgi:DNA-binding NtrC family response regulator
MIVGADPARRAALRDQLTHTMPTGTLFEELSTLSQVLDRAPLSRMVILSGRLEDISARSLMRMLSQRYPRLPVVSLDTATGPEEL